MFLNVLRAISVAVLLTFLVLGYVQSIEAQDLLDTSTGIEIATPFDDSEIDSTKEYSNAFTLSLTHTSVLDYNLPILNLSWHKISDDRISSWITDHSVEKYTELTVLDLSGNPLTSIEPLTSRTLQELKLEHGHLRKIKGLEELPKLEKLSLAYNRHLTVFDVSHPRLSIVDISHCGVTQLGLKFLPNIFSFIATNNRIITIVESTFASNLKLATLDLSCNEITHIDEYAFIRNKQLKYLKLAHNKIVAIEWTFPLRNVQNLNLSDNLITNIDLLLLESADLLDVSENSIDSLPENLERLLPNLTYLDIHSNSIRVINILKSSILHYLNLRDCKLQELSPETFLNTPSLQYLDLSDNKLQFLDFVTHLQNQSSVILDGNLWNCQCNLTTRVHVICSPSGLNYEEFCGLLATDEEYEPWFLHVGNPVFWAPPIVALGILIGGCFGLRAYRRCKARKEEAKRKSMDLLQNVTGSVRFDEEDIKKLLSKRLSGSRSRFPAMMRLVSLSDVSEEDSECNSDRV